MRERNPEQQDGPGSSHQPAEPGKRGAFALSSRHGQRQGEQSEDEEEVKLIAITIDLNKKISMIEDFEIE